MSQSFTVSVLLPSALFFNTLALALPTLPPPSYPHLPSHSFWRRLITSYDEDDERDLSDPLKKARKHNSDTWVYLVGKLLAGVAGLCAIIIIVFWLWRRRVRARRRRLGEMMGLGLKRNSILESAVKNRPRLNSGKSKMPKFSIKDVAAQRWRRDGDGEWSVGLRGVDEEAGNAGRREEGL